MSPLFVTAMVIASACVVIALIALLCTETSLSSETSPNNDKSLPTPQSVDKTDTSSSSSFSSRDSSNKDLHSHQMIVRYTETSPAASSKRYRNTTSPQSASRMAKSHSNVPNSLPLSLPLSNENATTSIDEEVFSLCGRRGLVRHPGRRQRKRPQRRRRHRQKRVVGGSNARRSQFPWVAMVLVNGEFRCGGSIVHARYVITAAHCFRESGSHSPGGKKNSLLFVNATVVEVIAGKHKLAIRSGQIRGEQRVSVDDVIPHPDYDDTSSVAKHNDLAIIGLQRPLRWTGSVRNICLPSSRDRLPKTATFVGWGSTKPRDRAMWTSSPSRVLKQLSVRVRPRKVCLSLTTYRYVTLMTQEQVCGVASQPGISSTCYGDSGGPLFSSTCQRRRRRRSHREFELHVQHGVLSWGYCEARPRAPSFFTRLRPHTAWILSVIRGG